MKYIFYISGGTRVSHHRHYLPGRLAVVSSKPHPLLLHPLLPSPCPHAPELWRRWQSHPNDPPFQPSQCLYGQTIRHLLRWQTLLLLLSYPPDSHKQTNQALLPSHLERGTKGRLHMHPYYSSLPLRSQEIGLKSCEWRAERGRRELKAQSIHNHHGVSVF